MFWRWFGRKTSRELEEALERRTDGYNAAPNDVEEELRSKHWRDEAFRVAQREHGGSKLELWDNYEAGTSDLSKDFAEKEPDQIWDGLGGNKKS